MADRGIWSTRLRQDHAARRSRRDTDGIERSDHSFQLLRQHSGHAAAMKAEPITIAEFDGYAEEYEASLAQGLSISGEDQTYFARGRVEWLKRCLDRIEQRPRSLMD